MSVELTTAEAGNAAVINEQIVNGQESAPVNDDAALEAIWNKNERDNGAARENGKFASTKPEDQAAQAATDPLEGGKGEEKPVVSSTPDAAAVPLPANWRGMEETWEKIPAELRGSIAAKEQELQSTLSEQGRQLSAFKPVGEVIQKYGRFFSTDSGYKMEDGTVPTPAQGIEYLFTVQDQLEKNTVPTLIEIIDRYGARDQIAAAFGQAPQGDSELRREIAGLKALLANANNPANIDQRIDQKFQAEAAAKAAAEEIKELSKDKPLFSEIPEKRMVSFINDAWDRLGDTAEKSAVLNLAYDMAVNADPELRAKAAAAKAAAVTDPKRVEGAKRAAGVNLTSTASGKGRPLTEEEELGMVFDKNQKG